ncbi:fluoride efflux transporter FluC [Brevibacterium casei]|uniref:Fluoride-specific ion channel FluC n=1 Tax=Brevibacterium casei CIP 102111 TaxID=1255625 RepID=A0A2H1JKJ7_9MICO|nr:CrcB family protein [Brevibacterium casei]QPR43416.1 CrcB family protein [Brevibacterium casei]SMX88046.1 CrcB protein [Brevibacterium casei CIP 102111]
MSTAPTHLRASSLILVAAGGTLGTAAREAISLTVPSLAGIPVAIFGINFLGAFLLGLLLSALARRGPDEGARRRVRLLVGTGFMGGFTTYSALATDAALLLGGVPGTESAGGVPAVTASTGIGIGYGLATLIIGGLATWAGIALGTITRAQRPHATTQTPATRTAATRAKATLAEATDSPAGTFAPDPTGASDPAARAPRRNGGRR